MGTIEVTRLGMKERQMETIAEMIARVAPGRPGDWRDYAWRWALCHLLAHDPTYADRFRALAVAAGQPLRVVGNLPYNISTPILFHLLEVADAVVDQHFGQIVPCAGITLRREWGVYGEWEAYAA